MRQSFTKRTFFLRTEQARESIIALVRNLPLDDLKPLQVTVEEQRPVRKMSQQSLLFAGPMRDISEQAWISGRQFSVEVWHAYMKKKYLPEDFDPEKCLDNYEKYGVDPAGERVLIGSTTMLTVSGYSDYLEQVFSEGSDFGVQFRTREQV